MKHAKKRKPYWWDVTLRERPKPVRVAAWTRSAARDLVLLRVSQKVHIEAITRVTACRVRVVGEFSEESL